MILNQVNFYSETLKYRCSMNVLLPQPILGVDLESFHPPFKVLYLLHGYSGDYTSWQRQSSIDHYADGMNLALVMPSVRNSFYTDMVHGGRYFSFVADELRYYVNELFPVSRKRENTFVAGLSMGGYGAFKLALTRPEVYSAAASLSGALDITQRLIANDDPENAAWLENMRNIFGDLEQVPGSQHDLFKLAQDVSEWAEKPRLYQCCGKEDYLYADNITFRDFIKPLGFDYTYAESPGEHQWDYWDREIQPVLRWL